MCWNIQMKHSFMANVIVWYSEHAAYSPTFYQVKNLMQLWNLATNIAYR